MEPNVARRFMPHSFLKKAFLNQMVWEQIWYKPHRALRWGSVCSQSSIWQILLSLLSSSSWRYSAACCLAAVGSVHLYISMHEDITQKYQTAPRHKHQIHKYIPIQSVFQHFSKVTFQWHICFNTACTMHFIQLYLQNKHYMYQNINNRC